jgi:hypothetical protein
MGQCRPVSRPSAPRGPDRGAVARGYLLMFVFYVHAMYGVFQSMHGDLSRAMATGVQIKLLAPDVSAFFLLSGMAAPYFHRKGWVGALRPSITLLVLAAVSHVIAVGLDMAIDGVWYGPRWFVQRMFKPIAVGTGYENYIAWFFVTLAFARLYSSVFLRSRWLFAAMAAVAAAACWGSLALGLPDNMYEWRNWPTATFFFLIGMRVPASIRLGAITGLAALAGTLALAWFNRPDLLIEGPCLACDLGFVAQPMIGQYGSLPIYCLQQILFVVFLLWVASWSRDKMPGQVAAYFGRDSLSMLLLHGWVLVALYPAAAQGLAANESVFMFVSILAAAMFTHALLFFLLQPALRVFGAFAFRASGWIMAIPIALFPGTILRPQPRVESHTP